ncbi:hypothetical protein WAI453_004377 [Rhynchosporium graminicola]
MYSSSLASTDIFETPAISNPRQSLYDTYRRFVPTRFGFQGVFIASADGSLILAINGIISSEFNDLEGAGWLITSSTLAMCATQPLWIREIASKCSFG